MKLKYTLSLVSLLIGSATSSFAWDDCGHKTVAAVAYSSLTDATKKKIDAIFKNDPRGRQFVNAATWPDDIKQGLRNDLNVKAPVDGSWHYVDIPFSASEEEITATINKPGVVVNPAQEHTANAVTAIRYYRDQLKTGSRDSAAMADALSWLIHLTGDVHQPLHCVTVFDTMPNYTPPPQGDRGGNGFVIQHPAGELHAFWDDLFDEPTGGRDGEGRDKSDDNAMKIAEGLKLKVHLAPTDIAKQDPATWARESYEFRQFVYSPVVAGHATMVHPAHQITEEYAVKAREIAEQRVVLAGQRLAAELEVIFGTN